MNSEDAILGFVKSKLEEGEGISSESLVRLLAAAEMMRPGRRRLLFLPPRAMLVAASLGVAACGWYFGADSANSRRENDVANVIALLSAADGDGLDSDSPLSDALCSWQDAPTLVAVE